MAGSKRGNDSARGRVTDALAGGRRRMTDGRAPDGGHAALVALQRAAGNSAVSALLAAKMRFPGDGAIGRIDGALHELKRDEPIVDVVETGLKEAKAVGIPVELEGPKPPASALAVTRTGFGPERVPQKKPTPPPKRTPAVHPLGKVGARAKGPGKGAGKGSGKPGGGGAAGVLGTAGAGTTGAMGAAGPMSSDQLLQPPVPPTQVAPAADPAFAAVTGRVKGFAAAKRAHPPASAKAKEAQEAALAPSDDLAGQAKAAKVDTMDAQPVGGFDKKSFITAVKAAIEAKSPKTLKEADDYAGSGKAGEVKGEIKGLVGQGKEGQAKDVEAATAAAPDTSAAVPKQVTPMGPEEQGPASTIPAAGAVPKPAPAEQVNLQGGKHQTATEMAEGGVTEQQLAQSNEPEFEQALADKKQAAAHADAAPAQFRAQEQQAIEQGKADATAQTAQGVAGMQGSKAAALANLVSDKGKAKSKDEAGRAGVTAKIQGIFAATEAEVKKLLEGIDPKVDKAFEAGEASARRAFESYVAAKMSAYKKDRYGGWLGGLRWAKDKLFGMPSKVDEFYVAGRELYLKEMDKVISGVADIVGTDLAAAKQRIAAGKAEIATYVKSLPADLQKVGAQASEEIGDRFSQLESDVDAKQDAVVDGLATKYVEARKGLDERIEELQAANKGLVDKAIGAIKAVINTIRGLISMLTGVLTRAAGVIGDIVAHPIRFLENLVAGVKGGILRFKENILDHLKKGLWGWLFGALAQGGVEIPDTFDIKGIIKMLASIFGLTWANIRNRIVKKIGDKAMGAIEQGAEIFQILSTQGVAGLWQKLVEKLGDIKEMIIEQVKTFVKERIITAGITWLIGLLNPAAAFIKACKMIYDIIMFFVENGSRILQFVNTVLDSVGDMVKGNVRGVITKVEDVLGKMVPILIGFLASAIGLGGIGEKIRGIIQTLQKPVNKALDFVIKQGLKLAGPLIRGIAGIAGKVKKKVAAGKAWVKGKVEKGKAWVKDKAAQLAGRFQVPFRVRTREGGVESHLLTTTVSSDGRAQTIVASRPTELGVLLGLYRARMPELPARVGSRMPRNEATTAINNIDQATQESAAATDQGRKQKATRKQGDNVERLLRIHAEFGAPARSRMAEEKAVQQQMTARITVRPASTGGALEMAGTVPRGTGAVAPRGQGYALFDPDDRLPPTSRGVRGGVYTSAIAAGTPNEVVTHGWAAGGPAYRQSHTGHTESQFDRFLETQGNDFLRRIVAIEIHSHFSPCSGCTDILCGIARSVAALRGSFPKAGLTFFYREMYLPPTSFNMPSRQAAQTTPSDLSKLAGVGWIVRG